MGHVNSNVAHRRVWDQSEPTNPGGAASDQGRTRNGDQNANNWAN